MQRKKAVEIIGYRRMRAKANGNILWVIIIVIGIIGWVKGSWYYFGGAIFFGFVFGILYSSIESWRIQKLTGISKYDMEEAYAESLVAKLDPITKNPETYLQYIDSIPDEE